MRFSVRLPTDRVQCGEEFASAEGIAEIAQAAERAGFDGCFVTDHPFPVQRWLDGGGHHALDPFVALSFAAAATTRIKLQTHILVLPYRNPFLAAKSALTLDVLSKGRLILGVATGYLRGEFSALGADFDARNEVSDESIRAMKKAWTEDDVVFEGRGFHARGNTMLPRPAQQPHPPVWVGGNSRQAIRRAVELAEGWVPFPNTKAMAPHTRTATIESHADLADRIAYAREHASFVGRSQPLDICFSLGGEGGEEVPGQDGLAAEVESLASLGVTWLAVGFPGKTRAEYLEALTSFGTRLARLR
jgi:probable F420-dependent oxidoreductase